MVSVSHWPPRINVKSPGKGNENFSCLRQSPYGDWLKYSGFSLPYRNDSIESMKFLSGKGNCQERFIMNETHLKQKPEKFEKLFLQ